MHWYFVQFFFCSFHLTLTHEEVIYNLNLSRNSKSHQDIWVPKVGIPIAMFDAM